METEDEFRAERKAIQTKLAEQNRGHLFYSLRVGGVGIYTENDRDFMFDCSLTLGDVFPAFPNLTLLNGSVSLTHNKGEVLLFLACRWFSEKLVQNA